MHKIKRIIAVAFFIAPVFAQVRQREHRAYHRLVVIACHLLETQKNNITEGITANTVSGYIAPDATFHFTHPSYKQLYQQECAQKVSQHSSLEARPLKNDQYFYSGKPTNSDVRKTTMPHASDYQQANVNRQRKKQSYHAHVPQSYPVNTHYDTELATDQKKPGVYVNKHPSKYAFEYCEHVGIENDTPARNIQRRKQAVHALHKGDSSSHTRTYTFDTKIKYALTDVGVNVQELAEYSGNTAGHALHRELITTAPHIAEAKKIAQKHTALTPFYHAAENAFLLAHECHKAQDTEKAFALLDVTQQTCEIIASYSSALWDNCGQPVALGVGQALYENIVYPVKSQYREIRADHQRYLRALPHKLGNLAIAVAKLCPVISNPRLLVSTLYSNGLATSNNFAVWRNNLARMQPEERIQEISRCITQEIVLPLVTGKFVGSLAGMAIRAGAQTARGPAFDALPAIEGISATQHIVAEAAQKTQSSSHKVYDVLASWNQADGTLVELVTLNGNNHIPAKAAALEHTLSQRLAALPVKDRPIAQALIDAAKNVQIRKIPIKQVEHVHRKGKKTSLTAQQIELIMHKTHDKLMSGTDLTQLNKTLEQIHIHDFQKIIELARQANPDLTEADLLAYMPKSFDTHIFVPDVTLEKNATNDLHIVLGGFHLNPQNALAQDGTIHVIEQQRFPNGCSEVIFDCAGAKGFRKTQFPETWTHQYTCEKIVEALKNPCEVELKKSKNGSSRLIVMGVMSENVQIRMVLETGGSLRTAYPKKSKSKDGL